MKKITHLGWWTIVLLLAASSGIVFQTAAAQDTAAQDTAAQDTAAQDTAAQDAAAQDEDTADDAGAPTLGLEQGIDSFETPSFTLDLVRASQTVAGLRTRADDRSRGFELTPADRLDQRNADGYVHLGDLTLRLRTEGTGDWKRYSTAARRRPIVPLEVVWPGLAAADLAPTLPPDIPLSVRRVWEVRDGHLALRFELENRGTKPVEIGALGMPLVFNNILTDRSLDEAHAASSFSDPYIGAEGGYLQVTPLTGVGEVLVVAPLRGTSFEAYSPLLEDPTPRGVTFEGFYEWLAHSAAFAQEDWLEAEPWNPPTSAVVAPGESRSYGVVFLLAADVRDIESTLSAAGRPVAVGIPGYVLPTDLDARLFLDAPWEIRSVDVEPAGALTLEAAEASPDGWRAFEVRGKAWGRARVTVRYEGGLAQTIHYKVIEPAAEVLADLGSFLTTEQWFENPDDPFGRSPSVVSYDYEERRTVTEDHRVWIAGLGDEGGSGSWLAAIMKQLVQPRREEVQKLERFVDQVVWGGLQVADGDGAYGVRKSLFYYAPEAMPPGTYDEAVGYGGWPSWDAEHAASLGRSYNYPHVTALYWVLYRLARDHDGLVIHHPWSWYLDQAHQTALAMVRFAPDYAQFGQMEGTVFTLLLRDLEREGRTEPARSLEAVMRERAEHWRSLAFPYGSEMPWDSTGQEEVYAWSRHFGFADKARVTLNAILGYTPTVPHWGYNGSARRYWDFQYAGKLQRVERQLHHYGSGLSSIPLLSAFRDRPDDVYLLRVGYGGLLGSIANITREGFGPSAFHAYPSTLRIDAYSGDFGPGLFGHAVATGTYLIRHPEFGWLAFGGNVDVVGDTVRLRPLDSARSRVFLAPLGLWLTLDSGVFEQVELKGNEVRLTLGSGAYGSPAARLRIDRPARSAQEEARFRPRRSYPLERGAFVIPLGSGTQDVVLASD